ncbi:transcriptional regulator [Pleionea sp. CnH1-48]|uniref:transcriptional regulator n=1 Tax=Pleionea sp. CnH1-48 TaxID=2954494 RepID=UPI0020978583|nr:transcriptional regulator [Pleionea sp. CnH1-48]MCO7222857.1 transcriptional regulator [Pleionea sp. CnH1-48]
MSNSSFNSIIHAPNRLQICALLAPAEALEFIVIKNHLEVSDSVLSKHIKVLEDAGIVKVEKKIRNGRNHTWVSLSTEGKKAFEEHVNKLKEIVGLK